MSFEKYNRAARFSSFCLPNSAYLEITLFPITLSHHPRRAPVSSRLQFLTLLLAFSPLDPDTTFTASIPFVWPFPLQPQSHFVELQQFILFTFKALIHYLASLFPSA